jgi:sugar phosphate isomerase/epimerase
VTHRILASTTSHKREPLLATLDVFTRLGLVDLDINLHHFIEGDLNTDAVATAMGANQQRVWIASGGWCDFFDPAPNIERTFESVGRQLEIARALGTRTLRLFFGRLPASAYSHEASRVIVDNLRRLSDRYDSSLFVFENHDGASLVPEVCRDVLTRVDRPNIRMNFDPINFAKAGVDPEAARAALQPFVAHVHLKGLDGGEYCEFGSGDVDLTPILRRLVHEGYEGSFTVEYEGHGDGTLRLHESVKRARAVAASLA